MIQIKGNLLPSGTYYIGCLSELQSALKESSPYYELIDSLWKSLEKARFPDGIFLISDILFFIGGTKAGDGLFTSCIKKGNKSFYPVFAEICVDWGSIAAFPLPPKSEFNKSKIPSRVKKQTRAFKKEFASGVNKKTGVIVIGDVMIFTAHQSE